MLTRIIRDTIRDLEALRETADEPTRGHIDHVLLMLHAAQEPAMVPPEIADELIRARIESRMPPHP